MVEDATSEKQKKSNGGTKKSWLDTIRRHPAGNILLLFVGIQIVAIVMSLILKDNFRYLTLPNFEVLFKAIPQIGIIALGVGILMIAGEFDLSVGSIFTFAAYIMAKMYTDWGYSVWLALLCALVIGLIIGGINGLIVTKSKVPSFIITLGTMYVWRGALLFVSQSISVRFKTEGFFTKLFSFNFTYIQAQFLWLILLAFLAWLLLERTKLGNHFFASGGNPSAATALGINVK
jgi:simple sugar transport system permease protein